MTKRPIPGMLYEKLKSFSVVARTLNLSHAVDELKVSRQTIARHISDLEDVLGYKLFNVINRKYVLTNEGCDLIGHVDILLEQTEFLLWESSSQKFELPALRVQIEENYWFYAQRHPVSSIWNLAPPLIQTGLTAWTASRCQLESKKLTRIRPYLVVYRYRKNEWICVEIGKKSSYASWLGEDWAKSAIGLSFNDDPIKSDADKFMVKSHEEVLRTGNPCYEHITTKFARKEGGKLVPINYQKAIFPIFFPNNSQGIAVLVARTNKIFSGAPESILKDEYMMDEKDIMEFNI